MTAIHCLVIYDSETRKISRYFLDTIEKGITHLQAALDSGMILCGHNIIKFDIPAIQKLYPDFHYSKEQVFDTLVASRLIYSDLNEVDMGWMKKHPDFPKRLFGSHSLEAWGYRLGNFKGEYKDWFKQQAGKDYREGDEWKQFSQEMLDYCVQDVNVTVSLYRKLTGRKFPEHKLVNGKWKKTGENPVSEEALKLEHEVAFLMAQQERNGFCFNEAAAGELYAKLSQKRIELESQCKELFKPWKVRLPDFIPKRDNKTLGYKKGVPVKKYKLVEFNPNSRDHIANRLQTLYGWKPEELTEGGKPKVDETILAKLKYPPCSIIAEYLLIQKRIAQLAEGNQAWLRCVRSGKIHGSVNTNGAVTGRATHSYPNISQVPANGSPYGLECRSLFTVPDGWTLLGCDASGLELRCLAHFMSRWDHGKYAHIVANGRKEEGTDVHTMNQKAAGLPTRDNAKTFIYGFLYGAGDPKIGQIVHGTALDGKRLRERFLKSLPALRYLSDSVKLAAKRGYIIGLDKRHVHVRSSHAALNTLLQSAGALICKKWLVLMEEHLQAVGLRHGWEGDYCFCAWSHDECQVACKNRETAEKVGAVALECIVKAGEYFNFKCPLEGEAKYGNNWADTH